MANKLSHWGCWRYLSLGSLEVPLWIVSCFIESILWRVRYLSPPRFLSFDDFPKPLCIATKKMIPRATPAGPNWFPTGPVRRREHNFHRRDSGLPCSCYTPNLRVTSSLGPARAFALVAASQNWEVLEKSQNRMDQGNTY